MRHVGGLCLALVICVGSVAQAVPRNKALAREAFDEGMRHYNLSEFKEALDSFKEAYRQYPDSTLLFNIGQCQRQLGEKQAAILSFKAYLRETGEPANRAEVQSLIAALEASIKEDEQVKNRPPQDPLPSSAPVEHAEPPSVSTPAPAAATPAVAAPATLVAQPTPAATPPKKRAWIWGVVAGSLAAAGLAVGLGVGLSSHDPAVTLGSVRGN